MKSRFLALDTTGRILVAVFVLVMIILAFELWWGFTPREETRVVHLRWLGKDSILVGDDKREVFVSENELLFWEIALQSYRGLDGLVPYDQEYYYQPSEEGIYWIVIYRGSLLGKWEPVDLSPFIVPPEEWLHLRYFRCEYPYEDNCFSIERFDEQIEYGFSVPPNERPASGYVRRHIFTFGGTWAVFRYDGPKTLYIVYPQ